jgi:hypothetical protein
LSGHSRTSSFLLGSRLVLLIAAALGLPFAALANAEPPQVLLSSSALELFPAASPDPASLQSSRNTSESGTEFDGLPAHVANAGAQREIDLACQGGTSQGKDCRARWLPILWQSFEVTAAQHLGNIALDEETRHDLVTNPYWSTYVKCVKQFRYDQWRDDDDFTVDYIAHGLQGAIASSIFEQNTPTGRGLVYVNNGNYWRSRLKGMAWSALYEAQWKIGPASEASIGNSGLNTYFTPRVKGRSTNETGFQDFVDTPVIGFWWNVGEDALDRFLMPHIWSRTHNKWVLTAASVMTPAKAAANILRYKPPYYRDFPIAPRR